MYVRTYMYVHTCGSLKGVCRGLPTKMKRREYRRRISKYLNFEEQIFSEFEELCKDRNVYVSHYLQQLMIGELEKKVVGQNPLNVPYRIQKEKPLSQQHDLTEWLPRDKALAMARRINMDEKQWHWLGETCHIIGNRKRDGYL
jgi:hypothetical protein